MSKPTLVDGEQIEINIMGDGSISLIVDGNCRYIIPQAKKLVAKMDGYDQATLTRKNDSYWSVKVHVL